MREPLLETRKEDLTEIRLKQMESQIQQLYKLISSLFPESDGEANGSYIPAGAIYPPERITQQQRTGGVGRFAYEDHVHSGVELHVTTVEELPEGPTIPESAQARIVFTNQWYHRNAANDGWEPFGVGGASLSDATPEACTTYAGSAGTSEDASRSDHEHPNTATINYNEEGTPSPADAVFVKYATNIIYMKAGSVSGVFLPITHIAPAETV